MRVRAALLAIVFELSAAGASAQSLLDYVGQCVPFARAASGIEIYGDAWTWWDQADGRYDRGHAPRSGAVIVFEKSGRLPLGMAARELTGRHPDYVGALIDAYAPAAGGPAR